MTAIRRFRVFLASAAFVALLGLAGWGVAGCDATDDETYDTHTERAERQLAPIVADTTGHKVESVTCPDDFDLSVGERYECEVTTTDGKALVVIVESTGKGTATLADVKRAGRQSETEVDHEQ